MREILIFIGGAMLGGCMGILTSCLCIVAGRADEENNTRYDQ